MVFSTTGTEQVIKGYTLIQKKKPYSTREISHDIALIILI